MDFTGHPVWDFRAHPSNAIAFRSDAADMAREEVRRAAFRSLDDAIADDLAEIDNALWALAHLGHRSERVVAACEWFRLQQHTAKTLDCGGKSASRPTQCFNALSGHRYECGNIADANTNQSGCGSAGCRAYELR